MFRGDGAVVGGGRCVSGHDDVRFAVPCWFHFNVAEFVRRIRVRVSPFVHGSLHPSTHYSPALPFPSLSMCRFTTPQPRYPHHIANLFSSLPSRRIRQRHISHAVLLLRRDVPLLVFVDDVDVLFAVLFDRDEES